MQRPSFDLETTLIRPGLQAPPVVCLSVFDPAEYPRGALFATADVERVAARVLSAPRIQGHNVAYDMACLWEWYPRLRPLIVAAYAEFRVVDTMVRERLIEIVGERTRKELSLDMVGRSYGFPPLDKESGTRTDYGRFWGRPLSEYPKAHVDYAIDDAVRTDAVGERQLKLDAVSEADVAFFTRRAFVLQMTRNRGLRTDPSRIQQMRDATAHELQRLTAFAQEIGLMRPDGSKNMKAIYAYITEAYDGKPPRNPPTKRFPDGSVKTDALTLEESEDEALLTFSELGEWRAVWDLVTDKLPMGCYTPIHTKFGMADTTRTTSSKPNVQNLRRTEGLRECFIPRCGYVFLHADHTGLESCTLAQFCKWQYGRDNFVRFLNAGGDLHIATAATIAGRSYADTLAAYDREELWAKDARQFAKIPNFGRPGGMGAPKLQLFARKQEKPINKPVEFWQTMIDAWALANPDGAYHLRATGGTGYGPRGDTRFDVAIPGTSLVRRGVRYAAACNTPFQALGSVVESEVMWSVWLATQGSGGLGGCHMVNFIHDEMALEAPDDAEHVSAAARELTGIMAGPAARKYLPDIEIKSEATAMRRWSKKAKSKWSEDGELSIWDCKAA